jgi:hypothetical protein
MNPDVFDRSRRSKKLNKDFIEDVCDGEIYRDLYDSEFGYLFDKNEAFTFSVNTDGISVCEQSNITIWVIFLVINEIPREKRFCLDNIIVAG